MLILCWFLFQNFTHLSVKFKFLMLILTSHDSSFEIEFDKVLTLIIDLVLQAEGWIEEKLKTATDESFENVSDLYDKMRKLQKHQAFESEIVANTDRIREIKEVNWLIYFKRQGM